MLEGRAAAPADFGGAVWVTPPLLSMLTDDLLKTRYAEHLDDLIALAEKEIRRTKDEPHYRRLAEMYRDRFGKMRHTWRCHDGNLVQALRKLQDAGHLEVITATATHAFFPDR